MSVWLHKDHKCYVFKSRITGGEPSPLVTASELDVEVGDQSVDVVIPLHLQAEWWGEGQVLQLHCVNVHLLRKQLQDGIRPNMFNWVFIHWYHLSKLHVIHPPTLMRHAVLTSCLGSTTSTRGSLIATSLMHDISKPYTFSHPDSGTNTGTQKF